MSVTTQPSADATGIRPFTVETSDAELDWLRGRIVETRWPDKELVGDQSQGVQSATIHKLADYWASDYDWRNCESKLNALPQFKPRSTASTSTSSTSSRPTRTRCR